MKMANWVGLVACGLGLLLMGEVQAKGLAGTEQQVVSILRLAGSSAARDPMFRCYHLGRLQGVADRLALDIVRRSAQPDQGNQYSQLTESAKRLHAKLDRKLQNWGADCVPNLSTRTANYEIHSLLKVSKKRLASTGAQDPVVGCFYAGRLKMLTDRFEKDLSRDSRQGKPTDPKDLSLLESSNQAVQQKRLGSCDASRG